MNFSRVQNLRRLLPAAPALTRDARSPAVSVQPSIGAQSRSQLGRAERRASRGCGRRDLGTTPGAGTPGARAARGQGGGSWCLRGRAERRCRQGGRLPMDVCGGRRGIEEQKEEEVGGATVAPSTRRRLGARAGCSAVNDERDTHSRSPALLPRPGFSAHPGSSGQEPGALAPPPRFPVVTWSRSARPTTRAPRRPATSEFPSLVHVSIPHSQPGGARDSLMRLRQGPTSRVPSPLFCFIFPPQCRLARGLSGAGRLRRLHFPG